MVDPSLEDYVLVAVGGLQLVGRLVVDHVNGGQSLENVYQCYAVSLVGQVAPNSPPQIRSAFDFTIGPVMGYRSIRRVKLPASGVLMVPVSDLSEEDRRNLPRAIDSYEENHRKSQSNLVSVSALNAQASLLAKH